MWTAGNQAGTYYHFEPSRRGKVISEILKGYTGPVMADGFGGYNRLEKEEGSKKRIKLAGCWAHARRKFVKLEKSDPEDVGWILDWLGKVCSVEYEARSFEHLHRLRQEKTKPLMEKLKAYLVGMKTRHLPESAIIKQAVSYTLKRWDKLTRFLDDPKIPLTNIGAERAMRHAACGMRLWDAKTSMGYRLSMARIQRPHCTQSSRVAKK